ncbi:MAG: DUF1641 domain-containing protein, partial [Vulcanisaeta sp.]
LIKRLDELGVLDSLNDLLNSEVVEDLTKSLLTTNIVKLLSDYDKLASLLVKLTNEETRRGVEKALDLLNTLNSVGVIDTLNDLLGDPEVLRELAYTLINTNTTYLMTNLDTLLEFMARIRCCAYVASLNAARDAATNGRSVIETLSEMLRDEDARRGLNFFLLAAKYLGRQLRQSSIK